MNKPRRQDEVFGVSKSQPSPSGLSPIPIEWLDPDCWRLPSGKALAEFALQAGFLAPLMLGMPKPRRQVPRSQTAVSPESKPGPVGGTQESRKLGRASKRV